MKQSTATVDIFWTLTTGSEKFDSRAFVRSVLTKYSNAPQIEQTPLGQPYCANDPEYNSVSLTVGYFAWWRLHVID